MKKSILVIALAMGLAFAGTAATQAPAAKKQTEKTAQAPAKPAENKTGKAS